MKRGLVDLSSVVWTELLGGKDGEAGQWVTHDGKEVLVNSAAYGYEGVISRLVEFMDRCDLQPIDLILVKEGMNSKSPRMAMHPGYKAGRSKTPESYVQFELCRNKVIQAMCDVGASAVWQDNVEADDVIGYLAQRLQGDVIIDSGDKDLAVLVSGRVQHHRRGVMNENPFGAFPHNLMNVYIALVGDASDKIPGAKGFGPKAWEKLHAAFGDSGLAVMETLIQQRKLGMLAEDLAAVPELGKIIDSAEDVYLSYGLGRLMVERVNTLNKPLQWQVGMVKPRASTEDQRLRKFAGIVKLIHAANYADALPWIKAQIALAPFVTLDIETSTPEASDDWIRRLDKAEGKEPVDVLGSKLTSLQLTFGKNTNFTVYLPIDNVEEHDARNLTVAQVRDVVDLVPPDKITWVHNASFELPICYMAWGTDWAADPLYHGFLRNVRDTAIASSYVDENRSKGLKGLSAGLLGYEQTSYQTVTTREYVADEWNGVGALLAKWLEGAEDPQPTGNFHSVRRGTGEFTFVPGEGHYGEPIEVRTELMAEVVEEIMTPGVGGVEMVRVQHKMNQLAARQVLGYGADDCICTSALAVHFSTVMEIEKTNGVFEAVETYPAYLTALAFTQGTNFSQESMREMQDADTAAYEKAWPVLRDYLISIGFDGTVCPQMLGGRDALSYLEVNDVDALPPHLLEFSSKGIKSAVEIILGCELKTMVRTPSKLAKLIELMEVTDEDAAARVSSLAEAVAAENLALINQMIAATFSGEPVLDLGSPKQLAKLLYDRMGLPVRIINDVTQNERSHSPNLVQAIKTFKRIRSGGGGQLTPEDLLLLRKKAKADETAVDFALAFDAALLSDEAKAALRAIGLMKKVGTRRNLFYSNYEVLPHWTDRKIHASANQCAAVTRRYSMSNPNLTQLPKTKDGAKFRGCFKPHKKNAVVCSIDFVAQELRLAAWRSKDKNMLACYVGDNLKDIHSLTAAGAIGMKWGASEVKRLFAEHGADLTDNADGRYALFCRLRDLGVSTEIGKLADVTRKGAKGVNFSAQNGAGPAKISEIEVMPYADAVMFLDAREEMFPGVRVAAGKAETLAKKTGHGYTLLGGIRHLSKGINSDDNGEAGRAARQAWSMEIQGSAAEMTKLAMARLWTTGAYFKFDARFIAPVHDELVDSVTAEDAIEFIKLKHWCMTQPYADMEVPILASISIGPDYHNQIECGDWFLEDRIKSALQKVSEF